MPGSYRYPRLGSQERREGRDGHPRTWVVSDPGASVVAPSGGGRGPSGNDVSSHTPANRAPGVERHFCKARLRDPVLAVASVILEDLLQATARVGIGPAKEGGFGLTVAFDLEAPRLDPVQATTLMERAHELRPCSGAARGNLDATLTVTGASIGRRTA